MPTASLDSLDSLDSFDCDRDRDSDREIIPLACAYCGAAFDVDTDCCDDVAIEREIERGLNEWADFDVDSAQASGQTARDTYNLDEGPGMESELVCPSAADCPYLPEDDGLEF